ncbi:MAG: transketolase [Candidatus Omnitrophota bacterium]|nr:transketolase [Candidatus Omnitrophota bacterium]
MSNQENLFKLLEDKARWVKKETLKIHKIASETRLASSLSAVEIFTVLYYGKLVKFNPKNIKSENRDRFIISKGHGAISFYPILADLGFFPKENLSRVCKEGCVLGGIPDSVIPGFETINGSLGHGLGVACGIALALKRKNLKRTVFVLIGDGELNEGSVWEAIMFAGEHRLDNLILIVDNNKACMLDFCKNIIDLSPLDKKFEVFRWRAKLVNGHNIKELYRSLTILKNSLGSKPKVLIADTVKGKGVPRLEIDPLSHIRNLTPQEAQGLIVDLE